MKAKFIFKTVTVIALSLFISFSSCKKKEKDPPATINYGTPTSVGIPTGVSNSATIDANGGTIFSADGRLEIIIPAGALAASTTISIQPVTNTTPGGAGVGYSLTPDGQQFSQPVTLRFHYDSTDVLGTSFRVFGIAYQKANKIWYSFNNAVLDSIAATESITTTHFSIYGLYKKFEVLPNEGAIGLGETIQLNVRTIIFAANPDPNEELAPLNSSTDYTIPSQVRWLVNGNFQGTQNDGTVSPASNSISTIYTAPSSTTAMSSNPVAVTAEVSGIAGAGASKVYLNSFITVRRPYLIEVDFKGTHLPSYACTYNYADHGSFYLTYNTDNSLNAYTFHNFVGTFDSLITQTGYTCNIYVTDNGNLLDIYGIDGVVQNGHIVLGINSLGTTPAYSHNCSGTVIPFPANPYGGAYLMPPITIDNNPHTVIYSDNNGTVVTVTATPQ